MTFWCGETLLTQLPSLIKPFDKHQVDINAYTLRMGTEYYCTSDHKKPVWSRAAKEPLTPGQGFTIPPGQFAFLQTLEEVEIPSDAMAFISMKATIKFEGLLNISGFHVDPGYKGFLVFAVYNAGSSPVNLEQGQKLFLIWYASLDTTTKMLRTEGGKSISRDLIKGMSSEILSLQSLSGQIAKLRNDMRLQYAIFAILGGALLAVVIGVLGDDFHDFLHPDIKKTQTHINADINLTQHVAPTPH